MAEGSSANGRPRVRRLTLVADPVEPLIGGEAAVRRYRLARLEQVAEATPIAGASPERGGESRRDASGEDNGRQRAAPRRPTT